MANIVYLVTGAAGFLGGTVCRKLIERGERVRAFVLPNDPAMRFVPAEAEIVQGDLTNKKSLERLFDIPAGSESIVFHIASIVTVDAEYNQKVMDVNVGGTQNIIELCKKHSECRKLVYCGSTGSIAELPKGRKIQEPSSFNVEGLMDCYSQSKALAAQAVLNAVKTDNLNACIVYPSGIMGPEDFAIGHTTKTMLQIIHGEMPVGIDGSFNLVDVRDLADGIISAADRGKKGEGYILGNEVVSFKEFASLVSEEANCKKMKFFIPTKWAYVMAKIMEKQAHKKGTKPVMTKFAVYNLARNNEFDSSKARNELGYTTRSYRETMHDEINWLKSVGKIS